MRVIKIHVCPEWQVVAREVVSRFEADHEGEAEVYWEGEAHDAHLIVGELEGMTPYLLSKYCLGVSAVGDSTLTRPVDIDQFEGDCPLTEELGVMIKMACVGTCHN